MERGPAWSTGLEPASQCHVRYPQPRRRPVAVRHVRQRNSARRKKATARIRVLYSETGEKKWDFNMVIHQSESGVPPIAGDSVFGGGMEGNFVALDARTGELLWHVNLGGPNASGPISYAVDGKHTSSAPARARCSCSQCRSDQKR